MILDNGVVFYCVNGYFFIFGYVKCDVFKVVYWFVVECDVIGFDEVLCGILVVVRKFDVFFIWFEW